MPRNTEVRIACQSAGMWGDLGSRAAVLAFLDAVAAAGYEGVGSFDSHLLPYRDHPDELRHALEARGLELAAVDLLFDDRDDEYIDRLAGFLARLGCGLAVVIGGRGAGAGDIRRVAGRLNEIGALTARHGVMTLYHHHSGTLGATAEQVESLLGYFDEGTVGLIADTGHISRDMTIPPEEFIRHHFSRLGLVEFKDNGAERGLGYEVGRGSVAFPDVAQALRHLGYKGWIMVEQNDTILTPETSARLSRAYVRDVLGW